MRKLTGALATGLIVATAWSGAAFAADMNSTNQSQTDRTKPNATAPATSGQSTDQGTTQNQGSMQAAPNGNTNQQGAAQPSTGDNNQGTAQASPNGTNKASSNATVNAIDMTKKKHMHAAMSRARVERVQTALDNSGANISIDGLWGPKTEAALKDFQKDHGLKATGRMNQETMKALPKVG